MLDICKFGYIWIVVILQFIWLLSRNFPQKTLIELAWFTGAKCGGIKELIKSHNANKMAHKLL